MLTHTSGLTYGFSNDNPLAAAYKAGRADFATHDGPLEEVVGRLCSIPLLFQPGTRWGYGVSTDVLGRLVEVISGKRFDRFVEESVLAPLGMSDTGFQVSSGASERLAALYAANDEDGLTLLESPGESAFVGNVTTFSGGAGLVSTVGDYFRFTEMLRRRGDLDGTRLLGRKTVEYMTRNHLPGDLADMGQATFNETSFSGIGFGLGFAVMLDSAKANILGSEGEYGWGGGRVRRFGSIR